MRFAYLSHLLVWMLPVIAGQWMIAGNILRRNLRAIVLPTLILGSYLSIADAFAVHWGIWYFDRQQTLGITLGPDLPVEEALFFFLTSLLVSQSLVMFLPDRLRTPSLP
jgi:lycopene cyclase domain-containing protein